MENIAGKFIHDLHVLASSDLPGTAFQEAQKCLLDYVGVTLAGAKMQKTKTESFLGLLGASSSDASLIGSGRRTSLANAVLINGLNSHAAELDDGERFGMIHPGAPVLSALLPLVECRKLSGRTLLKSIIIGYEAAIRIARAAQPSLKDKGYHATGTCGIIGAATAVASALECTESQMRDALSAAVTGASGTLKAIEDSSELKPMNVGRASLCGLLSAFSAHSGFRGPEDAFSGERGFFSIMTDKYDVSLLEGMKNNTFAIEMRYVKPYAACRHCHPPVEAALKIRDNAGLACKDIKSIEISTYRQAVKLHDHTEISSLASGKMSTPYSVAVILKTGKAGIEEFNDERLLNDPEIISLSKKVAVVADDELSALVPDKRSAVMKIMTVENNCFTEKVDYPKGEPENPLTCQELKDKFMSLAVYSGKSESAGKKIIHCIGNIEGKIDDLFPLIV